MTGLVVFLMMAAPAIAPKPAAARWRELEPGCPEGLNEVISRVGRESQFVISVDRHTSVESLSPFRFGRQRLLNDARLAYSWSEALLSPPRSVSLLRAVNLSARFGRIEPLVFIGELPTSDRPISFCTNPGSHLHFGNIEHQLDRAYTTPVIRNVVFTGTQNGFGSEMRFSYLHRCWLGLASDDRRIAIGALVVIALVGLAKVLGALKESAMAWRYGIGGVADAYQFAFTAVTWIPSSLVSVCSIMLVPFLASTYTQAIRAERQFLSEVNGAALLLGVLLSVLCFSAAEPLIEAIGSNLAVSTRQMAVSLATLMSPLAALALINGVLATRLQATGRHVNVLLEGLPPLVLLGFLLSHRPQCRHRSASARQQPQAPLFTQCF